MAEQETVSLHDQRKLSTGIDDSDRSEIATHLAGVLADSYNLYLKTQYYHWNVTGPSFHSLHLMFEAQYTELALGVDLVAERIRALGAFAPGTYREFTQYGEIKEDAQLPANANQMIENLLTDHQTISRRCREVMEAAEDASDGVTADLMNARLDFHEKTGWMLRSTMENGAQANVTLQPKKKAS